ncbi:MAG: DUF928 domain-containing protein [Acidobacteriota bacterium]
MKIAILTLTLSLTLAAGAQSAPQPQPQAKPHRVRTGMSGFDISSNSGKSANQVGGASRDLGSPKLFAPDSGKAFTTNPVFSWGTSDAAQKVTFRLTDAHGQTVYEKTTTENHLRYPADATPLTPGNFYTWTVYPENDVLGGPPRPVTMLIVGGDERSAIQSEVASATSAAAVADVFVKHHVWYDAVASYSDLLSQSPNNQDARATRASIYEQLPVTKELADADWAMLN